MARTGTKRENGEGAPPTICDPLAHPVRTRILDVLNEVEMSPVRFLDGGYSPITFNKRANGLSYLSYHFRELEKAGCIELVERRPVRGATEHIYRGVHRVYFSDEEFERLPFEKRQQLSRSSFQGLIARTDGAIQSGTFDKHPDRHMTWRAANVDQQGWDEINGILGDAFLAAERAREEAELRLADTDDEDADSIPYTFAMLGFESPPRKMRF
jgi:DNA-binding transcriptional ArsR family regulator